MTHLRKMMLEELQRRNYAENTIRHYCSCLGARGGGGFRRLGRAHPRKGDFVGWMRALELVDRDDLAREILPAFANYWGAEHSDVFTLDRCTWRNLDPIRERKLRLRAFNVASRMRIPSSPSFVMSAVKRACIIGF